MGDELVDVSLRKTCGAEETWVLTHVQWKHLPQVGHVPGEGAGHQSAGRHTAPCSSWAAGSTLPDNVPEQLIVRLLWLEVEHIWFQLSILQ